MYMFENTEKDNKQVKHTKKKIVRSKFDNFYTAKDSSNSIGNLIQIFTKNKLTLKVSFPL